MFGSRELNVFRNDDEDGRIEALERIPKLDRPWIYRVLERLYPVPRYIYMGVCRYIRSFPPNIDLSRLRTLHLAECTALETLPDGLVSLEKLYIAFNGSMRELPNDMKNMRELKAYGMNALERTPRGMKRLRLLVASRCPTLHTIESGIDDIETMRLELCGAMRHVPSNLRKLSDLIVAECGDLRLPDDMAPNVACVTFHMYASAALPTFVRNTQDLELTKSHAVEALAGDFPLLRIAAVFECNALRRVDIRAPRMGYLDIEMCDELQYIQGAFSGLQHLVLEQQPMPELRFFLSPIPHVEINGQKRTSAGGRRRDARVREAVTWISANTQKNFIPTDLERIVLEFLLGSQLLRGI